MAIAVASHIGEEDASALVQALLEANPAAASKRGQMGRYPLSLALLCEAPPKSVEIIQAAHPAAIREECITADYLNHGLGVAS